MFDIDTSVILQIVFYLAIFLGTATYVFWAKIKGKKIPKAPQLIQMLQDHTKFIISWLWRALEDGVITKEEASELKERLKSNFEENLNLILTTYSATAQPSMEKAIEELSEITIPEPSHGDIAKEQPPSE